MMIVVHGVICARCKLYKIYYFYSNLTRSLIKSRNIKSMVNYKRCEFSLKWWNYLTIMNSIVNIIVLAMMIRKVISYKDKIINYFSLKIAQRNHHAHIISN